MPLRLVLALAMLIAAAAKLADPAGTRRSLATYGIRRSGAAWLAWGTLAAAELALAVGLAVGWEPAAWGALALTSAGAALTAALITGGKAGRPCACFGGRSRIGKAGLARDLVLAAAALALVAAPAYQPTAEEWQTIGLATALLACVVLAVGVVALAREVGMLRMRLGPTSALEIPEEGPPLGEPSPLAGRFAGDGGELRVAVFLSPGCSVCEALAPAIESISGDGRLAVRRFDELADPGAWREADVPGSPYAVALDSRGVVLAKGTFNNLAQLEGLIGTAFERAEMAAGEIARA